MKAFKSTALARRLADAGHRTFCCATVREIEGMAAAGLGDDLLLANEVLGPAAERLGAVAASGKARVTAAVDSDETVDAAADAGVSEVPDRRQRRAAPLRVRARATPAASPTSPARTGMEVRGVMGYEGHLMREPSEQGPRRCGGRRGAAAGAGRRRRRRHLRRRHRHVEHQRLGHRAPGRQLLPDGHRVRARTPPEFGDRAVPVVHGDLGQRARGACSTAG